MQEIKSASGIFSLVSATSESESAFKKMNITVYI
jgi:hypothetical protein